MVLLIPLLVALFYGVHRHYVAVGDHLALDRLPAMRHEQTEAIVPVSKLNRATATALDYASSISDDVLAVHVVAEIGGSPEEFARLWREWSQERIPLELIASPYREVVAPLVEFVEQRVRRGASG